MYDELKRSEGDNPTIGIVLCSDTDDEMSSQFHKELAIMFDDPFERAEEERLELEREELRQCEIRKARIALPMLQPLQRERLMKNRTFMQRKEIEKAWHLHCRYRDLQCRCSRSL